MIKISNLFLVIFLGIFSERIEAMKRPDLICRTKMPSKYELSQSPQKSKILKYTFYHDLIESLHAENFDIIKAIIKKIKDSKINLNVKVESLNQPLFYYVLMRFMVNPSDFILKVIEYLIQNGVNFNDTYFTSEKNST